MLGVIFVVATITIFLHADVNTQVKGGGFSFAGFTLTTAAAFGYAAGWNPYASDYSRYLPKSTSPVKIAWAAGPVSATMEPSLIVVGVTPSSAAAGVASAAIAAALIPFTGAADASPTDVFVSSMPTFVRDITLVAIAIGAIAANALNIYSGAMSFLAAGVKIPFALRRAIIAIGFGVLGFVIALISILNASIASNYENFLLVIAYWIAPWLGIVLVDRLLRRGTAIAAFIPDKAKYRNPAGIISLIVAGVVSIWLFSNQSFYEGLAAKAAPIGDLTPLVGFVLAGVIYFILFTAFKPKLGGPLAEEPELIVGVDAADTAA